METTTTTLTVELISKAKSVNGRRRDRVITSADVSLFVETCTEIQTNRPDAKTIRLYPEHGFVPNAYKWAAVVTVLEASKDAAGVWSYRCFTTDAHRSYSGGPRITVNGRSL